MIFPELTPKKGNKTDKNPNSLITNPTDSPLCHFTRMFLLLSDPCLLPPLLGCSNLVSVSLIHHFSTQNQVLREKPSSLEQPPSSSAPIPPWNMFLSCGDLAPACNHTFKSKTILWGTIFPIKLPESRNMSLSPALSLMSSTGSLTQLIICWMAKSF